MRKIIIAFDGIQFSEGALEFAKHLNEEGRISLTGLFLPQTAFSNLWSYADAMTGTSFTPFIEAEDELVDRNIKRFEEYCSFHNIKHSVDKTFFDLALPELRKETRFADLIIIGSESFYTNLGSQNPSEYLKEALHTAECPVVVVPESYKLPETNILAYDGSESSVFAIKQFMYLFPEYADNPTVLVTTNAESGEYSQNKSHIRDLVAAHFSSLSFLNLEINTKKFFATWMSEKGSSILVCGAFSRSFISQLFRQSFVEEVLRDHKIPVFISHR